MWFSWPLVFVTLRSILRDRVLYAVLGVGALLILLVPVFSSFSMRQVQESAVGLAFTALSLIMLVLATQLGASSVFRDVDRRYTHSVLSLPLTRGQYIVARFAGLAFFLVACLLFLALCSAVVIAVAASTYPGAQPIVWSVLVYAFAGVAIQSVLLAAIALLFSAISTSFSLPFFCTIAVYLAGSASQEVYDYLTGSLGDKLSWIARALSSLVYYLCPNFSSFDFHVHAAYGLPIEIGQFLMTIFYGLSYTLVVVWLAVVIFNCRELP
ncbi:MAG: ABC-2 transporter permease [Sulfuriflexus sp.]|nr:ABC-2 transporter permease [Sulfuriflexus sp.]